MTVAQSRRGGGGGGTSTGSRVIADVVGISTWLRGRWSACNSGLSQSQQVPALAACDAFAAPLGDPKLPMTPLSRHSGVYPYDIQPAIHIPAQPPSVQPRLRVGCWNSRMACRSSDALATSNFKTCAVSKAKAEGTARRMRLGSVQDNRMAGNTVQIAIST